MKFACDVRFYFLRISCAIFYLILIQYQLSAINELTIKEGLFHNLAVSVYLPLVTFLSLAIHVSNIQANAVHIGRGTRPPTCKLAVHLGGGTRPPTCGHKHVYRRTCPSTNTCS